MSYMRRSTRRSTSNAGAGALALLSESPIFNLVLTIPIAVSLASSESGSSVMFLEGLQITSSWSGLSVESVTSIAGCFSFLLARISTAPIFRPTKSPIPDKIEQRNRLRIVQLIEESAFYKACLNNVENEDQVYVIASNEENATVVTHVATFMRIKSEKE